MKTLLKAVLLVGVTFSSLANSSVINGAEDLLRKFTLNAKQEFAGNFEGIDDFTLSHAGKLVFRVKENRIKVTMVSNANKHAWRSNYVYPRTGNVMFEVLDENSTDHRYKVYAEKFDEGDYDLITLKPKATTFYIVEPDHAYERRIQQLVQLGDHYEITGKYFGIVTFSAHKIEQIKFYEITNNYVTVIDEDQAQQQQNTDNEYQEVIIRGSFSGKQTRGRGLRW